MDTPAFTILAGETKTRFTAHIGLLVAKTGFFRSLLRAPWTETQSNEIDWTDWDSGTVRRFLSWLYTDKYDVPDPVSATTTNPASPVRRNRSGFNPASEDVDYSPVFLAHAKLYVFSQYTATTDLKHRIIENLLSLLKSISTIPTSAMVELVRYVYDNTDAPTNHEEPLRLVVSAYCALNYLKLRGVGLFRSLIEEGGDFVGDFWEKIGIKIENELGNLRNQSQAFEVKLATEKSKCFRLSMRIMELENSAFKLKEEKRGLEEEKRGLEREKRKLRKKCGY